MMDEDVRRRDIMKLRRDSPNIATSMYCSESLRIAASSNRTVAQFDVTYICCTKATSSGSYWSSDMALRGMVQQEWGQKGDPEDQ